MLAEAEASRIAKAVYFVGVLCILLPSTDLLADILPLRLDSIDWRYGAVGSASGDLLSPLVGLSLIAIIAHPRDAIGMLRLAGALGLLIGVALLLVATVFVQDALELAATVAPEDRGTFQAAWLGTFFKVLAGGSAFVWLGVATASSPRIRTRMSRVKTRPVPLVRESENA